MEERRNQYILEKEIDLIQACITRMAQNSFLVKGWMISLLVVVLGLYDTTTGAVTSIVMVVSVICFWYLDAFFLRTEKLYRLKYEWVIKNRHFSDDFCYDLNPHNKQMWGEDRIAPSTFGVMLSKTMLPFYLITIILLGILTFGGDRICFLNSI